MNPLEPILIEIRRAEDELSKVYRVAYRLYAQGALTDQVRGEVHMLRNNLYAVQQGAYEVINYTLDRLAPVAGTMLPEPKRFPDLPPANVGSAPTALPPEAADFSATRSGLLWAGLVLAVVGAFFTAAAVFTVLGRGAIEQLGLISRHAMSVRENTRRYLAQLEATEARFRACIEQGGAVAECMSAVPLPDPPMEKPPSSAAVWGWVALAGGIVAVAGLGVWAYREYRHKPSSSKPRRAKRLRGASHALPSGRAAQALSGAYNMEVE